MCTTSTPPAATLGLARPRCEDELVHQVQESLFSDLLAQGWTVVPGPGGEFRLAPPENPSKEVIRRALLAAREPVLQAHAEWIRHREPDMRNLLADGHHLDPLKIRPALELCDTQARRDIFRYFRYYWSSPGTEYVGRRLRFLVRDDSLPNRPVIGLLALGSSIIHVPERDRWIGWDVATRTERIGYMMDMYVLGALPPYNQLLAGKLLAYIAASNEIREFYKRVYAGRTTFARKRELTELVLLVTTSLYGARSSQYNRLKYKGETLYQFIGVTRGYGSMHISPRTFALMRNLLAAHHIRLQNHFGAGPNWRLRVIRAACDLLGIDAELILQHSFQRGIWAVPLAINFREYLLGEADRPVYKDRPMALLTDHWRQRWLLPRITRPGVMEHVHSFNPQTFSVLRYDPLLQDSESLPESMNEGE